MLQKIGDVQQKFITALSSKQISQCAHEEIKEPLRLAMIKVGLRAQNWPNDIEKLVLVEHTQTHFGRNKISEIVLAFDLAIAGQLDLPVDEVKCYENFSCLYFSTIMNSFIRWATQEYRQIEQFVSNPKDEEKYYQGTRTTVHWGYYIDEAYIHFLSFKDEQWQKFPSMFYTQLESDGLIERDYWRAFMVGVRKWALKDLVAEKIKLINGKNYLQGERKEAAESIRITNLKEVEKKILEYETGKKDDELELMAKQRSVIKLFEVYKQGGKEHIYEPAD